MAGVIHFFEGQNIFVTGATGFLGKVLLEKLIRMCPDVGNIFVLVRPRKGMQPSERVQNIISLPVIAKYSVQCEQEIYCSLDILFINFLNIAYPAENLTQAKQVSR
jgi:nucleoside-diphosphate-sugar epimerase